MQTVDAREWTTYFIIGRKLKSVLTVFIITIFKTERVSPWFHFRIDKDLNHIMHYNNFISESNLLREFLHIEKKLVPIQDCRRIRLPCIPWIHADTCEHSKQFGLVAILHHYPKQRGAERNSPWSLLISLWHIHVFWKHEEPRMTMTYPVKVKTYSNHVSTSYASAWDVLLKLFVYRVPL